ncbi:hypothetical protein DKX38_018516 [Salix brachista]|uniref:Ribosomal protein L34Ae n=1 Tax=Salix brachista TaxID=2182728 RepID=A0A5N5KP06_9ROSI|nr:hypothetical protein DKX38_018516 [Salix brachista]
MMTCSRETLVRLFYNVSSSSFLLLLLLYFSSTLLLKLINFIGSYPIIQRNQNGYDYNFSDEDEEEEDETYRYYVQSMEKENLAAGIIHGGEREAAVQFVPGSSTRTNHSHAEDFISSPEERVVEDQDGGFAGEEMHPVLVSAVSESENDDADMIEEEMLTSDTDSFHDSVPNLHGPTAPVTEDFNKSGFMDSDENRGGIWQFASHIFSKKSLLITCYTYNSTPISPHVACAVFLAEDCIIQEIENKKADRNFSVDEKFLIYAPTRSESRKLQVQEKDEEEIFGDSCTVGSTSKSSSEWRSSIKDSGTEDPFSSSSRRSCPRWESYTLFQKYDEEMMFLDRISVQKLHETESLRSIKVNPRSFSDRIVHKISTINKKPSDIRQNPYHELEGAYVAQVCLTWEALNWNYKNFERKRASQRDHDPGCPAHIAQQFQQFQVLLQRYIENEPYEQGRRPEVYARMRRLAPKLLLVPEYRDSEDDQRDDANFGSRISSAAFLMIMEDGIRTFMNFLKADKEKTCQVLLAFFRRNRRGSVDPVLLQLMKKVNKKKKIKLKDLRRGRSCIRKRKLTVEEEMEILMGLIDLKLVSRVLRMTDMSEEQLHWCEEKMSKVRLLDGKLQRDSSPLFFPAH